MKPITAPSPDQIEADFWRELAEIEAESIGWLPLSDVSTLDLQISLIGQALMA
jgi:hypothetical protein